MENDPQEVSSICSRVAIRVCGEGAEWPLALRTLRPPGWPFPKDSIYAAGVGWTRWPLPAARGCILGVAATCHSTCLMQLEWPQRSWGHWPGFISLLQSPQVRPAATPAEKAGASWSSFPSGGLSFFFFFGRPMANGVPRPGIRSKPQLPRTLLLWSRTEPASHCCTEAADPFATAGTPRKLSGGPKDLSLRVLLPMDGL